jgi:hypothetical protein
VDRAKGAPSYAYQSTSPCDENHLHPRDQALFETMSRATRITGFIALAIAIPLSLAAADSIGTPGGSNVIDERSGIGPGPTERTSAVIVWTDDEASPLGMFYMDPGWSPSVVEEDGDSVLYFHNAAGAEVGRARYEGSGLQYRIVEAERPVHRVSP